MSTLYEEMSEKWGSRAARVFKHTTSGRVLATGRTGGLSQQDVLSAEDEAVRALSEARRRDQEQQQEEQQRGLSRAALRRKKKQSPTKMNETEDIGLSQATVSPAESGGKKKRKSGEFVLTDSGNSEKRQRPSESLFATSPSSALGKVRSSVRDMNGVLVRELIPGSGRPAQENDSLSLLYTLRVGSKRIQHISNPNAPFFMKLGAGQVVPGLDAGLVGLRPGGSRELAIPPALGYGETGQPQAKIPPNATLNFSVKLLEIQDNDHAVIDFDHSQQQQQQQQHIRRRRPRGTRGGVRVNKRRLAAQVASECGNFVLDPTAPPHAKN